MSAVISYFAQDYISTLSSGPRGLVDEGAMSAMAWAPPLFEDMSIAPTLFGKNLMKLRQKCSTYYVHSKESTKSKKKLAPTLLKVLTRPLQFQN